MNDLKKNILRLLPFFLLAVAGAIIYSNSLYNSFHFDDFVYIVNNYALHKPARWGGLLASWGFSKRIVLFLSLALNYYFGQSNVIGYHIVNISLHVVNSFLVYWLVLLLSQTLAIKRKSTPFPSKTIGCLTALVFLAHPIQTQAVNYIYQRGTLLAAFFYLLAFCLYLKGRLAGAFCPRRFLSWGGAGVMAVLGVLTKENFFTLPIMLWVYEMLFFWQDQKIPKKVAIWAGAVFLTFCVGAYSAFIQSIWNIFAIFQRHSSVGITAWTYLLTQFRVIVTYLRLMVFPVRLNLDYDYSLSSSLWEGRVMLSLMILGAIFLVAWKLRRKEQVVSFGIFWFFLALSIESSVIPLRDVIFEHRLYLPSIGLILAALVALFRMFKNQRRLAFVVIPVICLFSVMTYSRNRIWKNELTLWNDVVKKSPDKVRAYMNRGVALAKAGRYEEALTDFNKAIEMDPKNNFAYLNRGMVYKQLRQDPLALRDFDYTISIEPRNLEAYNNRGDLRREQGKLNEALLDFNIAIRLDPQYAEAYNNRALVHAQMKKYDLALSDYTKALELLTHFQIYYNRGNLYRQMGNLDLAAEDYKKALELNPRFKPAYDHLRSLYAKSE